MRSDVFSYVFLNWSPAIFAAFLVGLSLVGPEPEAAVDPAWVVTMLALSLVTEAVGFRLSRGCPCDALPGSDEMFDHYREALSLSRILALPAMFAVFALFMEREKAFALGLFPGLLAGLGIERLRLHSIGAIRYKPTPVSSVESRTSFAHWAGMLLLLLSAAALWQFLTAVTKFCIGWPNEPSWVWTTASDPLAKRLIKFVLWAFILLFFCGYFGLIMFWLMPQIFLVRNRVNPHRALSGNCTDDPTDTGIYIGLAIWVDILVFIASIWFF